MSTNRTTAGGVKQKKLGELSERELSEDRGRKVKWRSGRESRQSRNRHLMTLENLIKNS